MSKNSLIYLLIFLIPIQLGRHFFFDFSRIAGVANDYLLPTVYLTDIIIFLIIAANFRAIKTRVPRPAIVFLIYCLISALFIAGNKGASVYRALKITEFTLLIPILINAGLQIRRVALSMGGAVIYSSILAIGQFMEQSSAGGWWWYLGERTFRASTPGIALGSAGGELFLRPYATFAHPNVLGGFLASGLLIIIWQLWKDGQIKAGQRLVFYTALILGTITLILTFSRASWAVFLCGLVGIILLSIEKKIKVNKQAGHKLLIIFCCLILISVILPPATAQITGVKRGSLYERSRLVGASLNTIKEYPLTGTGLNNSIPVQYQALPKNYGLFVFQPVHNAYLLTAAELGLTGLAFLLFFLKKTFSKISRGNIHFFILLMSVLALGLFDHYIISLQQGMILTAIFISLIYTKTENNIR